MKTIPTAETIEWNKALIKNLAFIKQKLRYPFTRQVLSGSFFIAILISFVFRFCTLTGIFQWHQRPFWANIFITSFLTLLIILVLVISIVQLIKFVVVPTPFALAGNLDLLEKFMTAQHLAFSRHPDAPEVFQIVSKNVNLSAKYHKREVMIFIADDKRILVNSHFTKGRFTITPPSKHYRQMANRLKQWITIYYNGGSAQPARNKF